SSTISQTQRAPALCLCASFVAFQVFVDLRLRALGVVLARHAVDSVVLAAARVLASLVDGSMAPIAGVTLWGCANAAHGFSPCLAAWVARLRLSYCFHAAMNGVKTIITGPHKSISAIRTVLIASSTSRQSSRRSAAS